MSRICSGLSKAAGLFCLSTKHKTENEDENDLEFAETAALRNTYPLSNPQICQESGSVEILCPPPSPTKSGFPYSGPVLQAHPEIPATETNLKVDWTSGARKETVSINWKISDFHALYELKDLLRNETLVFSAGNTINAPTRWCFNLQRMKNESNIGLFLKRLKPLSLSEDVEEFQNRNRNASTAIAPLGSVVPQVPTGSPSSIDDDDCEIDDTVYIHYECIIRRSGYGEIWLHKRTCIPNFEIGQRLGFRKLFTIEDLREAEAQPQSSKHVPLFSADNTLILEIKFNIHLRSFGKTKAELSLLDSMSRENDERFHYRLLSAELGHLVESGMDSDIILLMEEDDRTFSVHKGILAARSAVFAAMFHSGMRESRTGVVRIKDVSSRAMESLLCYAYSGSANIDMDWKDVREVQDLIYAADKYSLRGLKDLCDHSMYSGCTKENAMELLYLAQSHGLNTAVKKISMFIKRFYIIPTLL